MTVEKFEEDLKDGVIFCYLAEVFTRSSLRESIDHDDSLESYEKNIQLALQTFSKEHKLPELKIKEMVAGETESLLNAIWVRKKNIY